MFQRRKLRHSPHGEKITQVSFSDVSRSSCLEGSHQKSHWGGRKFSMSQVYRRKEILWCSTTAVKIILKWTWHLEIKGLIFHPLWALELCQPMARVSALSHSEYDFSVSFNAHYLPSSCMNSFTILGRCGREQAILQVLVRYKPGMWTIVKLGSCKLVLSLVCQGEELDVIYLTKNRTMWKYTKFFYLHSDSLPISSTEKSGQPMVMWKLSAVAVWNFHGHIPACNLTLILQPFIPHCCSLNQKWK